jgi:hypothetical protein
MKRFGPPDAKLQAKILVPGYEITTEEDWPEESR